jgi:hypothetical protein
MASFILIVLFIWVIDLNSKPFDRLFLGVGFRRSLTLSSLVDAVELDCRRISLQPRTRLVSRLSRFCAKMLKSTEARANTSTCGWAELVAASDWG